MSRGIVGASLMLLCAAVSAAGANEWLTFGHDPERSGWNRDERGLSPRNISGLNCFGKPNFPSQRPMSFFPA